MSLRDRYLEAIEWMLRHPRVSWKLRQHVADELVRRKVTYEGKPMPISLVPILLEPHEQVVLKRASERLWSVLEKLLTAARHDPEVQAYLSYEDAPRAWIDSRHGYTAQAPLTRLDALFDGKTLKFIEFNTDNPGGKGWTDAYEEVIAELPVFREIVPDRSRTHGKRVTGTLFDAVMTVFRDFDAAAVPVVAFIDYRESQVQTDSEIAAEYFRKRGVHAVLADPRDFTRHDGKLWLGDRPYNCVLRCMKGMEFVEHQAAMAPFLEACFAEELCLINPFRAMLGSEKSLLSAVSNPRFYHYYSRDEIRVILDHVPWTRHCGETETLTAGGRTVLLDEYLRLKRADLVLKPSRGFGGKGVIIGRFSDDALWAKACDAARGKRDWVVQEYVEVPTLRVPDHEDGGKRLVLKRKYFNLSPFVFAGKYAGALGRYSDSPVVNVSAGGAVLPVYNSEEPAVAAPPR